MRIIVYLPFLASALVAVAGPRLVDRMPPKTATRLLLTAGLTCAVSCLLSLSLLAWTLIGRLPLVAAVGAWSGDLLHRDDPVPTPAAKLATITLATLAGAVTCTAARHISALRRARRACRRLGGRRLVVLDQADPEAFAVPAIGKDHGRIVVSTGMLRLLTPNERRILLAHETAHLERRHHRHRILAALITAADPLLATLPAAVHHLTERWADEDAAATTGDRRLAARTLARAALAVHRRSPLKGAVLCFGRGGVGHRVRALLADAPHPRRLIAALLGALLAVCALSAAEAGRDSMQLLDQARDHYTARPLAITTATRHEIRHLLVVLHRLSR